jgi:hypothetical protein
MTYINRKMIWMKSMLWLPVSIMLFLANGILYGQASVHLESGGVTIDVICEITGTYQFIGTNSDGMSGTFALYESPSGIPVPGHITDTDLTDNMAILDPVGLDGAYRVNYSYLLGGVTISVSSIFSVTILNDVQIQNLPDTVCKNDSPYPLVPVPSITDPGAIFAFSGPGVYGNQSTGYFYNPASSQVAEGQNQISMVYTSSSGCQYSSNYFVYNAFVPTVSFSTSSSCIPTGGGLVHFSNLTSGKYAVETWAWNFGDPDSGPNNTSSAENPDHFYPFPGERSVVLTAETFTGCVATLNQTVKLSDEPLVDFTWISDCFIRGTKTSFLDRSVSPYAKIDQLLWTFRTQSGGVLGQIPSNNPLDTIEVPFASMDEYSVTLDVENEAGCAATKTKSITLKPIYKLAAEGFEETFNDPPTDWFVDSENGIESWVLGEPDFIGFNPTTGDLGWYTDLPDTEGYLENSWVQSPCFDLSDFTKPLVRLDIMKSFVPGTDGAVLQYQKNVSDGWKTIGLVNEGINWYNSYGIFNEPGGSSYGWGLPLFDPDVEWIHAGYAVNDLTAAPYVKFRIAIGTNEAQLLGNQGFAFDNFAVGERIKNSILEHFTNSTSLEAVEADSIVKQFVADHSSLVVDIQYHMDYPGEDPMNINNPVPPSVRSFNYGVPNVPYAVLNGGSDSEYRYDFSGPSEQPDEEVLTATSLEIPPFDVDLNVVFLNNNLEGNVKVTCNKELFNSNIQLYVVVIEKLVTAYTGAGQTTSFRNVVMDMLPSAGGKLLGNDWSSGIYKDLDFNWSYASYVEDVNDLEVVAFILDRDHDQVLQTAVVDYSPGVGYENIPSDEAGLALYPNPAREFVYVNFGAEVEQKGQLTIVDLAGRSVISSPVLPGYAIQKLDLSSLSQGVYFVSWVESGVLKGREKLVHIH